MDLKLRLQLIRSPREALLSQREDLTKVKHVSPWLAVMANQRCGGLALLRFERNVESVDLFHALLELSHGVSDAQWDALVRAILLNRKHLK